MASFRVIISDPDSGTSQTMELKENRAAPLIGRKVDEVIDGSVAGLSGYKLRITGGSDRDGFPIRPNVHGGVRRKITLSGGVGFNPEVEGERRRKTVRGKVITNEIVQINMKIVEKPQQAEKGKDKEKEPPEEVKN